MNQLVNNDTAPIENFSYTVTSPGAPITAVLSAIGFLLSAYDIVHDIPIDPNFDSSSLTVRDDRANNHFMDTYMALKMFIDGLARDFKTVRCNAQSNGVSVYLKFGCY